jgi:hypothetical protein
MQRKPRLDAVRLQNRVLELLVEAGIEDSVRPTKE